MANTLYAETKIRQGETLFHNINNADGTPWVAEEIGRWTIEDKLGKEMASGNTSVSGDNLDLEVRVLDTSMLKKKETYVLIFWINDTNTLRDEVYFELELGIK